jgi:TolB-like protein
LVIAVGMLLVDKFITTNEPEPAATVVDEAAEAGNISPSVAVLPFVNMSADENSTYVSDGLADTVLHMLAQVRELRVAARTSSFQFRDQTMDVAEIGRQLNVSAILEGSVQRSGDTIRVTAQLIDVSIGFHLWSGNFDRDLENVFAIQDEIALEVVAALKVSLLGETVDQGKRFEEAYRMSWRSIASELMLGNDDAAFDKLALVNEDKYRLGSFRALLEHSSLFAPLREEPAFTALVDEYREHAKEQRLILQAAN